MGPSNAVSLVPGLRKVFEFFKIAGYDRAAHVIKSFCSFVKEEISRHKTSPEFQDVHDFINSYLEKQSKMTTSEKIKHYFSERNLEGNVNILFLAASDTIFSSLGWLLRLMSKHRDIQQKVYTELMEVLGKDGIARYKKRESQNTLYFRCHDGGSEIFEYSSFKHHQECKSRFSNQRIDDSQRSRNCSQSVGFAQ
ncbi:putative cytochrome P450 516B1, partial [Stegodyphus mimosarum]